MWILGLKGLSHFLETPRPKVTKIAQKIVYKSTNRLALIWFLILYYSFGR